MKVGIDVSNWQGKIDWNSVKENIDFAIIRAGYEYTIDNKAKYNAAECQRLGIPFGFYWFSYAYNKQTAEREAQAFIDFAKKYRVSYPLYFDFEYDSVKFAKTKGAKVTANFVQELATVFCEKLEQAGFYAGIYSNLDFIKNYYGSEIFDRFTLWFAQYPENTYGTVPIHQYSNKGRVIGINSHVDLNKCYVDFPSIIKHKQPEIKIDDVVMAVLIGEYGNGSERQRKITEAGHDYLQVQERINLYYKLAEEVIAGKYGNYPKRKRELEKLGADYSCVQFIVNEKLKK